MSVSFLQWCYNLVTLLPCLLPIAGSKSQNRRGDGCSSWGEWLWFAELWCDVGQEMYKAAVNPHPFPQHAYVCMYCQLLGNSSLRAHTRASWIKVLASLSVDSSAAFLCWQLLSSILFLLCWPNVCASWACVLQKWLQPLLVLGSDLSVQLHLYSASWENTWYASHSNRKLCYFVWVSRVMLHSHLRENTCWNFLFKKKASF